MSIRDTTAPDPQVGAVRPGIEISEYDPAWPRLAARAITELENALPGVFVSIEHIGTAGTTAG
ncbi:GrpB protein [Amycolatopsis lurida]|uniref:GrpB family protein n=1 Tax=Amycolatopsis lurida TaxID=31959 RepID=UPI000899419D|nr:GrpB family protein [Amycolatopsis lurida]SEB38705.1 GrpB protein [Amycolatopsis lurida]